MEPTQAIDMLRQVTRSLQLDAAAHERLAMAIQILSDIVGQYAAPPFVAMSASEQQKAAAEAAQE